MLKKKKKYPFKTMTYCISKNNACHFRQTWYNSGILTKREKQK